MLLQEDAPFVASTINPQCTSYYRLNTHSDYKHDRAYISDYTKNLDSSLEIQRNLLRFAIVLQFLVLQSQKHHFQYETYI